MIELFIWLIGVGTGLLIVYVYSRWQTPFQSNSPAVTDLTPKSVKSNIRKTHKRKGSYGFSPKPAQTSPASSQTWKEEVQSANIHGLQRLYEDKSMEDKAINTELETRDFGAQAGDPLSEAMNLENLDLYDDTMVSIRDEVSSLENIFPGQVTVTLHNPFDKHPEDTRIRISVICSFPLGYPKQRPNIHLDRCDDLLKSQIQLLNSCLITNNRETLLEILFDLESTLIDLEREQNMHRIRWNTVTEQSERRNVDNSTAPTQHSMEPLGRQPSTKLEPGQKVKRQQSEDPKDIDPEYVKQILLYDKKQPLIDYMSMDDVKVLEEEDSEDEEWTEQRYAQQVQANQQFSRFRQDFDEHQLIGSGGFGKVWRARNRFDGNLYAIKQILLDYSDEKICCKTKNEAIFLSRLQHRYIVRYYQSWTEDVRRKNTSQKEASSRELTPKQTASITQYDVDVAFVSNSREPELDDPFAYKEDDAMNIDWLDGENQEESVAADGSSKISSTPSPQEQENKKQYLYIQMEFCGGQTLKNLIDKRRLKDLTADQRKEIIRQILEALNYLHQKRLIHRDLKPQNIFLDDANNVKLGDFGLATEMKAEIQHEIDQKRNTQFDGGRDLSLTQGCGTYLYLAPEQEGSSQYDQKADMFSLGIIIFEMYYEFKAEMERQEVLKKLKLNRIFPEDFHRRVGSESTDIMEKIRNLIQKEASKRPEAKNFLLEYEDKQYKNFVKLFVQNKDTYYQTTLQAFFDTKLSSQSTEIDLSTIPLSVLQQLKLSNFDEGMLFTEYFKQTVQLEYELERIFQRCGGCAWTQQMVCLPMAVAHYCTLEGNTLTFPCHNTQSVNILTEQGTMLQYASNLIDPWIQSINKLPCMHQVRRYSVAETLKRSLKGGLTTQKVIAFDIVWKEDTIPDIVLMAELCTITNQIKELFEQQQFTLRVHHSGLLECLLLMLQPSLSIPKFYQSFELQQYLRRYTNTQNDKVKSEIQRQLQAHFDMDAKTADTFIRLLMVRAATPSDLFRAMKEITKYIGHSKQVQKVLEELQQFRQILIDNNFIEAFIEFSPLSFAETRLLYHGIFFELVLPRQHKLHSQEVPILVGGNYSTYLQHQRRGCGIQIYVDQLMYCKFLRYLTDKLKQYNLKFEPLKLPKQYIVYCSPRPNEIDVVVHSNDYYVQLGLVSEIRALGYSVMAKHSGQEEQYNAKMAVTWKKVKHKDNKSQDDQNKELEKELDRRRSLIQSVKDRIHRRFTVTN